MEKIETAGSIFETLHSRDNYWGEWVLSPMSCKVSCPCEPLCFKKN